MPKRAEPNGVGCSSPRRLIQAALVNAGRALGWIADSYTTVRNVKNWGWLLPTEKVVDCWWEAKKLIAVYCLRGQIAAFSGKWELRVGMGKDYRSLPPLMHEAVPGWRSRRGGFAEQGVTCMGTWEGRFQNKHCGQTPLLWAWLCYPVCWEGVSFSGTESPRSACAMRKSCKELLRWMNSLKVRIQNELRQELASPLLLTGWQRQPRLLYKTQSTKLTHEITFSLPFPPTIPLFWSGSALSVCLALPQPTMQEHWQPELTSRVALLGQQQGAGGSPADMWGRWQSFRGDVPENKQPSQYDAAGVGIAPHLAGLIVPCRAPAFYSRSRSRSRSTSLPP